MVSSKAITSLLATSAVLVAGHPTPEPQSSTQTVTVDGKTYNVEVGQLSDSDLSKRSSLERRDGISSCGDGGDYWIPVSDTSNGLSGPYGYWAGYYKAASAFCKIITTKSSGTVFVPPGGYARLYLYEASGQYIGSDGGDDPNDRMFAAAIDFEIHNKGSADHYPAYNNCVDYMMRMAYPSSKCYGTKHKDTKGGTYQVGDVSYHALPTGGEA